MLVLMFGGLGYHNTWGGGGVPGGTPYMGYGFGGIGLILAIVLILLLLRVI